MLVINDKEKCSGCTACQSICPVKCINMIEDDEGFKYPQVDIPKCTNCNKCVQVCPVINSIKDNKLYEKVAYLSRVKNTELLMTSTSGGIGTALAKLVVQQGGTAYGAVFNKNFEVVHEPIKDIDSVVRLAGSKYVQSEIGLTLKHVKIDLDKGEKVYFCGTPCQVAGLKNYLIKDYSNLVLVDLVCHGVPSPKLWKEYINYLIQENGALESINFRKKAYGYHVATMEEKFITGKRQLRSGRTNLMLKCFFSNIADRPICYNCPFKTYAHASDLTLFDGWHASELVPNLKDDDRGYTNIIVHTKKGEDILGEIKPDIDIIKVDMQLAINLDGNMMLNVVQFNDKRNVFYKLLNQEGIKKTVNTLIPILLIDNLIEKSKIVFHKIGIIKFVKKVKSLSERV